MIKKIIKKTGIKLAIITALISGFAVFFNKLAVTKNIDPFQFTALKNILVGLILTLIILTPSVIKKLKDISKNNWLKLITIGVIGGSVPFLLFFKGLSMASAASAGFIHKTLFIWVAIFAIIFLKEKITILQYVALGILLIGNILLGGLPSIKFGYAELIILLATIMWSIESIIAKKMLKNIDAGVVAWGRMFFGAIILLAFVLPTSGLSGIFSLQVSQWSWIFLSAGFLTIYVVTWYNALKYEKASTVASVLVLASPITTMLDSIYSGSVFEILKLSGVLIIFAGVILFILFGKKFENMSSEPNGRAI